VRRSIMDCSSVSLPVSPSKFNFVATPGTLSTPDKQQSPFVQPQFLKVVSLLLNFRSIVEHRLFSVFSMFGLTSLVDEGFMFFHCNVSHSDATSLQLTADDLKQFKMMSGMLTEQIDLDDNLEIGHMDDEVERPDRDVDVKSDVEIRREQHAAPIQLSSAGQQHPKHHSRQDLQLQRQLREHSTSRRTLGAFRLVSKFPAPALPQ
jgi:hypothetical protein